MCRYVLDQFIVIFSGHGITVLLDEEVVDDELDMDTLTEKLCDEVELEVEVLDDVEDDELLMLEDDEENDQLLEVYE